MIFNKFRNEGKLTLQDLFSDEMMEHSLDKLSWTDAEDSKGRHRQHCKLRSLNKVLAGIIKLFDNRFKLGKYIYEITGNMIIRYDPTIVEKPKKKGPFTISKSYKIDLEPDQPKGIVTQIK